MRCRERRHVHDLNPAIRIQHQQIIVTGDDRRRARSERECEKFVVFHVAAIVHCLRDGDQFDDVAVAIYKFRAILDGAVAIKLRSCCDVDQFLQRFR